MKHILSLFSLAVASVVLALTSNAGAQTVKPSVVTIVRIQGEARYSLGNDQWHPLVVGKVLGAGAVIQTATDAMVDLVLSGTMPAMPQAASVPDKISMAPDPGVRGMVSYKPSVAQNVIRMWGSTVLAIDKLTVSDTGVDTISDTELDLRAGRIFGSVSKLSAASQYLIKIPNGVAGVRGTTFTISADGKVIVFSGSVVVSYIGPDGKPVTVVVNAGNEFDPSTGQTTPLTRDQLQDLKRIAIATQTLYHKSVSFDSDLTTVWVSPTTGKP